jgi:Predicted acyltransferase
MISIRETPLEDVLEIRQAVMYPEEAIGFVKLEEDPSGFHFGLYDDERLVSVVSLFENGTEVQFRKFATLTELQGRGYGSQLMSFIMRWAAEHKKTRIWCNARKSATEIYKKFGMRHTGESWIRYGIDFVKMEKYLD